MPRPSTMRIGFCVLLTTLLLSFGRTTSAFLAPCNKRAIVPAGVNQHAVIAISPVSAAKLRPRGGQLEMAKASSSLPTNYLIAPINKIIGIAVASASWIVAEISQLSKPQKLLFGGVFCLGFILGRIRPFWHRFVSVMDIPGSYFGPKAPILKGRAVTVSDGDTVRFLHVPTPFHPKSLKKGQKSSEFALQVRVCTIDTPETAKFGKSGQAFGKEAKEYLTGLLKNKAVYIRMLQKDQYGRAVCQVFTKGLFRKTFVDEGMLEAGLAEVYQGGGAVYGPKGKDEYVKVEQEAKKNKLGIWSQKNRESAADYKKRTK